MSEIRVDTISEKTSANGVAVDGVTLKDGAITSTAASTITVADNSDTLTLKSTDTDAAAGPILKLSRDNNSASASDVIPEGKKIGDGKTFPKKVAEVKAKVKGVKYSILYMKAIKALQEAQTRIETLETKVTALEG